MPAFRTDLPAGEAIRRYMRSDLKTLTADLGAAEAGRGVHPARKRLKALRSVLAALRPALGDAAFKAENRTLREAAHALAPLRRAEAMGEVVRKLAAARGHPSELEQLAAAIDEARLAQVDSADHREAIAAALAAIKPVRGRLAAWTLPRRDITLYVDGMRTSYAQARKRLAKGLADENVELLHEARKAVIHHYHHLELLKPLWPNVFKAWLAELRDLREQLGDLHDLDELEACLKADGIADSELRAAGIDAIGKHRSALIARISGETAHLFAERPSSFAARIAALWERQQAARE